jgi:hypothetical protein
MASPASAACADYKAKPEAPGVARAKRPRRVREDSRARSAGPVLSHGWAWRLPVAADLFQRLERTYGCATSWRRRGERSGHTLLSRLQRRQLRHERSYRRAGCGAQRTERKPSCSGDSREPGRRPQAELWPTIRPDPLPRDLGRASAACAKGASTRPPLGTSQRCFAPSSRYNRLSRASVRHRYCHRHIRPSHLSITPGIHRLTHRRSELRDIQSNCSRNRQHTGSD